MSEQLRETTVELVKLQFGLEKDIPRAELEDTLKRIEQYEISREEWERDLNASRKRIEAGYQDLLERTESTPSDSAPPHAPDFIASDKEN